MQLSKKLYYKIGEVCEIVGVESHVLRFWETEFPMLSPPKSKSGQRIYRPKDIELLLEIRKLLYDDKFTIAGARKQLSSRSPTPKAEAPKTEKNPPEREPDEAKPVAEEKAQGLDQVRQELQNILTLLDRR